LTVTDVEPETPFAVVAVTVASANSLSGRRERTVRQHAVAVYRKSGLSGRAELSAFFLEDLLLPVDEA